MILLPRSRKVLLRIAAVVLTGVMLAVSAVAQDNQKAPGEYLVIVGGVEESWPPSLELIRTRAATAPKIRLQPVKTRLLPSRLGHNFRLRRRIPISKVFYGNPGPQNNIALDASKPLK